MLLFSCIKTCFQDWVDTSLVDLVSSTSARLIFSSVTWLVAKKNSSSSTRETLSGMKNGEDEKKRRRKLTTISRSNKSARMQEKAKAQIKNPSNGEMKTKERLPSLQNQRRMNKRSLMPNLIWPQRSSQIMKRVR